MKLRWALCFGTAVGLVVAACDWLVATFWHNLVAAIVVGSFVSCCGAIIILTLASGVRRRKVPRRAGVPVSEPVVREIGPAEGPGPVRTWQLLADMEAMLPDILLHQVWSVVSLGVRETREMTRQIGLVGLRGDGPEAKQVEAGVGKVNDWLRLYIKYQIGPNPGGVEQFLAAARQVFEQFAVRAHAGLGALVREDLKGFRQAAEGIAKLPEAKDPAVRP